MRSRSAFLVVLMILTSFVQRADAQTRGRRGQRSGTTAPPVQVSPEVRALADANNQFAWELYAQLREEKDGNLFFSPQSISIALAMTWEGARGETARQFADVLHIGSPQSTAPSGYARLLAKLNGLDADGKAAANRGYQLTIANRLFGQQGYTFLDPFLATLRDDYKADLGRVDFVRQTEAARTEINNWVAKETNDKIKDLIPPGAVDDMTRLVLCNAIYFKGLWTHPFTNDATQPMAFHLTGGQQVDVPMMYQKERFRWAKHSDVFVLDLPYQGDEVSMLAILPTKMDGLVAVEKSLTPAKITEWTASMGRPEVEVWLPKFKNTSEFMLNAMLTKLGMTDAFVPGKADFSGMNGKDDLYISAALHKAFVEVNEEGTEAAAATGIVASVTSAPIDPPQFRADHPFIYVIRDNASGSILFAGRVMDPRK